MREESVERSTSGRKYEKSRRAQTPEDSDDENEKSVAKTFLKNSKKTNHESDDDSEKNYKNKHLQKRARKNSSSSDDDDETVKSKKQKKTRKLQDSDDVTKDKKTKKKFVIDGQTLDFSKKLTCKNNKVLITQNIMAETKNVVYPTATGSVEFAAFVLSKRGKDDNAWEFSIPLSAMETFVEATAYLTDYKYNICDYCKKKIVKESEHS